MLLETITYLTDNCLGQSWLPNKCATTCLEVAKYMVSWTTCSLQDEATYAEFGAKKTVYTNNYNKIMQEPSDCVGFRPDSSVFDEDDLAGSLELSRSRSRPVNVQIRVDHGFVLQVPWGLTAIHSVSGLNHSLPASHVSKRSCKSGHAK